MLRAAARCRRVRRVGVPGPLPVGPFRRLRGGGEQHVRWLCRPYLGGLRRRVPGGRGGRAAGVPTGKMACYFCVRKCVNSADRNDENNSSTHSSRLLSLVNSPKIPSLDQGDARAIKTACCGREAGRSGRLYYCNSSSSRGQHMGERALGGADGNLSVRLLKLRQSLQFAPALEYLARAGSRPCHFLACGGGGLSGFTETDPAFLRHDRHEVHEEK